MCNFYMMYYWKTEERAPWHGQGGSCVRDEYSLFQGPPTQAVSSCRRGGGVAGANSYPPKASALLPPSPLDEEHAKQASISFGNPPLKP